jgi:hypothetical protein
MFLSFLHPVPYVIYSSNVVHDPTGNNDGLPDYDESIQLDVTLDNVGLADALGVAAVISTTDPYVTVTSANASYGTISASSSMSFCKCICV